MPARNTTWQPITPSARLYPGPPRDLAGGLGNYIDWQEPPISTDYIGPVQRWPSGKSIFANKVAPYAWSSPYADPTGTLQHVSEGGGVGQVPAGAVLVGYAQLVIAGVTLYMAYKKPPWTSTYLKVVGFLGLGSAAVTLLGRAGR